MTALFWIAGHAARWPPRVCFGTMLMPFAISLNNHLPAAAASAVVLSIYLRGLAQRNGQGWWLLAGLAGGFLAANELPALSMTVGWAGILLLTQSRALMGYCIGVAIVAGAFFGTNWIAHESLRPPYAHRGNGDLIAQIESADDEVLKEALISASLASKQSTVVVEDSREASRKRLVIDDHQLVGLVESADGGFSFALGTTGTTIPTAIGWTVVVAAWISVSLRGRFTCFI